MSATLPRSHAPTLPRSSPAPYATRTALKEWAVACEALGRGQQILLLRKGGIREEHREFRLEHPDFLLFPTYEHQRADLVKPIWRPHLEATLTSRGPADRVSLRHWATVAEVFEVSQTAQLDAVASFHLWSDGYALERLRWRPRHPLQLLALRVYELAEPATIALVPEYGGCKSWLSLAEPIAVHGARPVLDQTAFAEQLTAVRRALSEGSGGVDQA